MRKKSRLKSLPKKTSLRIQMGRAKRLPRRKTRIEETVPCPDEIPPPESSVPSFVNIL